MAIAKATADENIPQKFPFIEFITIIINEPSGAPHSKTLDKNLYTLIYSRPNI